MFVGEQPGDKEDRQGHPFAGPSGRFLDDALEIAGIDRNRVYITNAVKHFKWARSDAEACRARLRGRHAHRSGADRGFRPRSDCRG
ncbi:MAG: uracil-DNA glycosylase family protein [Gemmatimonadaceae bacterium]